MFVVGVPDDGKASLYPSDGGEVRPIPALEADERPIQWSPDGRSLYVHRKSGMPNGVWLLELSTGRRRLFREIRSGEPSRGLQRLLLTPDGRSYAYGASRVFSELYVVDGLR